MSQPIELLIAFTGGGLLAALLSWARAERSENKTRAHELARLRLEKLYGPLYFLTERNRHLIEHIRNIHQATDEELISKNWANDETTRSRVNSSVMQSVGVANSYVVEIRKNNSAICELFGHHYSYIFQEDSHLFQKFALDHSRLEMEHPADSQLNIPYEVYKKLGLLRFIHPEVNDLVRNRVLQLQRVIST
jgi:hypothetical protein